VNAKKLDEFGGEDLKLIKINYFIIIIITSLVSLHVNASDPDGIKLNNEAVELIHEAVKARSAKSQSNNLGGLKNQIDKSKERVNQNIDKLKDFEKKSTLQKLWGLIFGGGPDLIKPDGESNDESDEKTDKVKQDGFYPGQDKKDKEEGNKNVDEDLVFDAHKKFLQATLKSGELAEVRMNLGLSFELSGDKENSLKAYNMAENVAKGNPGLEFMARYNKARLLADQKKIPLALKEYQSALDINPESLEVKTNIELLMQQQQGGGGGGEGEDKDQKGEQGKDPKDDPNAKIKKNPKNSEYKSQNLSKKDVQKILEELKNQEQNIREKEYNKGVKEKSRDKDW